MKLTISIEDLRELFSKPYGEDPPTKAKWAEFYNENVTFIDPTPVSYTHLTLPTNREV